MKLSVERIEKIKAIGFDRPFGRDSFMPEELTALCDLALTALKATEGDELRDLLQRAAEMRFGSEWRQVLDATGGWGPWVRRVQAALAPKQTAPAACEQSGCVDGWIESPAEGSRVLVYDACPKCNPFTPAQSEGGKL